MSALQNPYDATYNASNANADAGLCSRDSCTSYVAPSEETFGVAVNRQLVNKTPQSQRARLVPNFENINVDLNSLQQLVCGGGFALACGSFTSQKPSPGAFVSTRLLFLDFDHITLADLKRNERWQTLGAFAHATGGGGVHAFFILDKYITTAHDLQNARGALVDLFSHLNPDRQFRSLFMFGYQTKAVDKRANVLPLALLDLKNRQKQTEAAHTGRKGRVGRDVEEKTQIALESRLSAIAGAAVGERNTQLWSNLLPIAGRVKAGQIDASAIDEACGAALATGLTQSEVNSVRKWAWRVAKPAPTTPARATTSTGGRPPGASDAARKAACLAPHHGTGVVVALYYDRLALAGLRAGDSVASYRAVNRALGAAGVRKMGYKTHQALLKDDLFADGYMPTFDEIQRYYGVESSWVTGLNPGDVQSIKTYRQAMSVTEHQAIEQHYGQSVTTYQNQADKWNRSLATVARDTRELRESKLLQVEARWQIVITEATRTARRVANRYRVTTTARATWHLPYTTQASVSLLTRLQPTPMKGGGSTPNRTTTPRQRPQRTDAQREIRRRWATLSPEIREKLHFGLITATEVVESMAQSAPPTAESVLHSPPEQPEVVFSAAQIDYGDMPPPLDVTALEPPPGAAGGVVALPKDHPSNPFGPRP